MSASDRPRPAAPALAESEARSRDRLARVTGWISVIQVACVAIFAIDLFTEFSDPRQWATMSVGDLGHFLSEFLIMVLLMVGILLARQALRQLRTERDLLQGDLRSLRGEFDSLLHARFDEWALTPAQRDVALLTLRGLRISEMARLRGSAQGTIKAHLGAVFRAAGVRTRGELTGHFMEEFLDLGAAGSANAQPPREPPAGLPS